MGTHIASGLNTRRHILTRKSIIGIKINKYNSFTDIVKVIRKYDKSSMSEIKDRVQNRDYVLYCDYIDSEGLEIIIKAYIELTEKGIGVELYEHGRATDIQLLYNLLNTYEDIEMETDAEIELEEADIQKLMPYEYMWTTEQKNWIVIKDKYEYSIINKTSHMFLLVEDDELNNQIASMMIMMGNEVVTSIEELGWNE